MDDTCAIPADGYSFRVIESLWVARLVISVSTAKKLSARHGLDANDVHDAVVCVRGLLFVWDDDPERGRRAIVETQLRGQQIKVVLYPVNDPLGDVYALGSAYPQ
jgi:hypothetical protein